MDARSDGQLLAAWSRGVAPAFEALVDRHQSALLRYAGALVGPGRGAEDLVQEAFLRLMEKPPVIAEPALGDPDAERAVLRSWLVKTTKRISMDATRSRVRRARREEEVAPRESTNGRVHEAEERDTRAAVEASLLRLPADQREALTLRLFGEQSYKDIAEVMNKKVGTVGWLISVGMKALQRELAPLLGLDEGGPLPAVGRAPARNLEGGLS